MILPTVESTNLAPEGFYAPDCPSTNGIMSFVAGSGTTCEQTATFFAGKTSSGVFVSLCSSIRVERSGTFGVRQIAVTGEELRDSSRGNSLEKCALYACPVPRGTAGCCNL
ncbi:hypothetical protein V9T40_005825 [Parthenolecanium corni]|uniref:Uncharacterized protein n=1 Tax=Parthenolecanium corni TaxID=536013 RepID=A0AAN9YAU4_9HEMI